MDSVSVFDMFCINIPEDIWQDNLHNRQETQFGLKNAWVNQVAGAASPSFQESCLAFLEVFIKL